MQKKNTSVVVALSAAIVCVAVVRRLMQPKIVGRWEELTEPRPTMWHFRSSGTLELTRWPWWVVMKYTVRNNTVCITNTDGSSHTYLWRLEDDRLILSGSEQSVVLYRYVDEA